ncbi:glycosyltransferase [Candidatus Woesearchaeota archaeon]|nr:glycosyltransferase [Candidatus Woesearchaeota archaeon]
MSNKVSVIVPNYNMGRFLPRAVESVANQKYSNIEVIIADDGSEDNSPRVMEDLSKFSRDGFFIVALRLSHGGSSIARNMGLKSASGDFVTFLDADDTLPAGSLDSRVEFLLANPKFDGVFTDANKVEEDGKMCHAIRPPNNISSEQLARLLITNVLSPVFYATFMLRKTALEKSGNFDHSYTRTEDLDFVFRVLTRCEVAYLPLPTYNYHTSTHGYGERLSNRVVSGITRAFFISNNTSGLERLKYTAKAALADFAKLGYEFFTSAFYTKQCLGQNGTPIYVPKFKTMIPEADEQLDMVLNNGIDEHGKPVNDDRITKLGRILRKYWIDELPQLFYNIPKRQMSLVGIRPRREVDWEQIPQEHRDRALRYKPGFFGVPYSNPNRRTFQDLIETESRYLAERELNPYRTQLKYFFLICYNILFKGTRGR